MKVYGAILLQLATLICFAQTNTGYLKGEVRSKGEKLELAAVALLKTSFAVNTDSTGAFEFKDVPAGKYQLRASCIGHENFQEEIEIKGGGVTHIHISLIPLASQMNEVVVTGNFKEATKLESVSPVDVYTARYFQRNPTNNLWDALNNVNGVFSDVDNGVANTSDIQINGIEGNYTMILIDGVPAMNGLAGIYVLNALPVSMIDKVEILRGPSSTLYGSDAIGGVVNIITKNPNTSPTFTANVEMTSYLETNADLTGTFKLKNVSSLFSLSTEEMNYRWDLNGDNFTDIPLTNRANFYNKWSFIRKDSGIANIYARYLFEDRFGGQTNTPGRTTGSDQYYTQWIRTNQWQAGFQYQLPIKERVLLMADYSEHYQNAWFGLNYYAGKQRSAFAQITWDKKIDKHHDLLFGASYRMKYYADNTGLSNDSLTGVGKVLHIGGIFLEDEIAIKAQHKLLIGARFDYTSSNGPVVTPRINYKWNSSNDKNVLRIGFGTGYRVPNLLNDGFGVLSGERTVVIEGKLSPEQALTSYANYTRMQELPTGILNIDVSWFYTYFTNYIDPDYSQPGLVIYQNSTHGAQAPGFSIDATFAFNYPLKVGIGVTYVDVYELDIDSTGAKSKDPAVHSPHITGNFYFSYNFPVPQLSIDWTGNVISPMWLVTEPNDFRPAKSPWYSIQNIQVTKKFKKGMEVYFGLKNFFNFIQPNPIMRAFDPFNREIGTNNPQGYVFDTEYGFTTTQGITGFIGFRYRFQ